MPLAIPAELKKISPFIKRAEELDKDKSPESRLVAYYLRQYAVSLGIPLAGSSAGAKTCLGHILGDLEQEKKAMDNFTRDEAAFICRKFAQSVFDKADAEDRAGKADKNTAKTFYAAQSFLQMLDQFAAGDSESEQAAEDKRQILYSKWKATEILKAIKEGRQPVPGGYGEDAMMAMDTEELPDSNGVGTEPVSASSTAAEKPANVETVAHDDDDFGLPAAPTTTPVPPVLPPPPPIDKEEDEQGTEVELGPPPSYPGGDDTVQPTMNERPDRPALTFDVPPVEVLPPALTVSPPKSKSGLFGFIKKPGNAKNASKAQLLDATELTRFALAALEEKDGELAAERLQQALDALLR